MNQHIEQDTTGELQALHDMVSSAAKFDLVEEVLHEYTKAIRNHHTVIHATVIALGEWDLLEVAP